MDANNLNILVEAKREYMEQLCAIMCPMMIEKFEKIYEDTRKACKNRKVLLNFQKTLKDVADWNDHTVKQVVTSLCDRCSWFNDLLAAVFVSFVKILSSIRLNSNKTKISVKLPANSVFIHGCMIAAAKDLYKDPYIYYDAPSEYERDAKLYERFSMCIETTVKEMLPVQEILKTYIASQDDGVSMDTEDPQDFEDPEITEEPEEPEESEEPEETEETEEPEDASKVIDIGKKHPVMDDDVLFSDAPEYKKSPADI